MKNAIGLNAEKSKKLAELLNDLLANYQLFYINTRGFHWNITGDKFFELHAKFEELYTDALGKVDELAERIRTLEQTPLHSFTAYLKQSSIKEASNITDGIESVKKVLEGFKILLEKERELLKVAEDAGDEGTASMMSDYIREQEKLVWMYSAFLK
jgi:starvation-inducible DNA-binding protein